MVSFELLVCDHEILFIAFALKNPEETHRNLVLKGLNLLKSQSFSLVPPP